MELYENGFNPYNMIDKFVAEQKCLSYFEIRVSYGAYDYYEDNTISKVSFLKIQDCYNFIREDSITCKQLKEPKIYYIITYYEYSVEEDTYYYSEYEVHKHRNGKYFLKRI